MQNSMWRVLPFLMAAEVVYGLEVSMILSALSSFLRKYADPAAIGWIITAYLLVAASSAALCGRLGDLYGRKLMLVLVIAGAAIGSIISAVGPSLGWIVAGRAVQGVAGAIVPLCFGLAREHIAAGKVPTSIGVLVATNAVTAACGLLLGGVMTDHLGPQSIFWLSAAVAALIAVALMLGLPSSKVIAKTRSIDWLGGILFAPAVAILLLVFSEVRNWGWTSPTTLSLALVGVMLLVVWAWHESRQVDPLIDVKLLANRDCALANVVFFCTAFGVTQVSQLLSLLVQQPVTTGAGLGLSATSFGMVKFPALITGLVSSLWAGWASTRYGGRLPLIVGGGLMTISVLIGVFVHDSLTAVVAIAVLSSLGLTAVYTGAPNVIVAASPSDRTSEAAGMMQVIRAMGQAIGAQCIAVLLGTSMVTSPDGKMFPSAFAYTLVFGLLTAASAVAMLLAFFVPRGKIADGPVH